MNGNFTTSFEDFLTIVNSEPTRTPEQDLVVAAKTFLEKNMKVANALRAQLNKGESSPEIEKISESWTKMEESIVAAGFKGNHQFGIFFENLSHVKADITRSQILNQGWKDLDVKGSDLTELGESVKEIELAIAKGLGELQLSSVKFPSVGETASEMLEDYEASGLNESPSVLEHSFYAQKADFDLIINESQPIVEKAKGIVEYLIDLNRSSEGDTQAARTETWQKKVFFLFRALPEMKRVLDRALEHAAETNCPKAMTLFKDYLSFYIAVRDNFDQQSLAVEARRLNAEPKENQETLADVDTTPRQELLNKAKNPRQLFPGLEVAERHWDNHKKALEEYDTTQDPEKAKAAQLCLKHLLSCKNVHEALSKEDPELSGRLEHFIIKDDAYSQGDYGKLSIFMEAKAKAKAKEEEKEKEDLALATADTQPPATKSSAEVFVDDLKQKLHLLSAEGADPKSIFEKDQDVRDFLINDLPELLTYLNTKDIAAVLNTDDKSIYLNLDLNVELKLDGLEDKQAQTLLLMRFLGGVFEHTGLDCIQQILDKGEASNDRGGPIHYEEHAIDYEVTMENFTALKELTLADFKILQTEAQKEEFLLSTGNGVLSASAFSEDINKRIQFFYKVCMHNLLMKGWDS